MEGFDRYKYNCVDTSPLSKYVMHPFWNKTVLLCPTWIAPNLLTLVGFICCVFHYLIPAWYDYNFTASTLNSTNPIPQWSWALVSFLLFASHTLDGIDGKQVLIKELKSGVILTFVEPNIFRVLFSIKNQSFMML